MAFQSDPIILKAFLNESSESVGQLESDLQALETDLTNMDLINSVFRALHTIKGNSSFLDLSSVTEIAHEAETILHRIRNGDDNMSQETIDVIFSVVDILRSMISNPEGDHDTSAVMKQLLAYSKSNKPIVDFQANKVDHSVDDQQINEDKNKSEKSQENKPEEKHTSAEKETRVVVPTIRIEEAKVEKMVNMVNELKIVRYGMEALPALLEHMGDEAQEIRFSLDLAISKMTRISSELGSLVYGARLVPVDNVFRKFPRVVRDLSAKLKKEIRLEIKNGDAELDKSIVEAIADPMTHLIRNSADHGVELPEEREKNGKKREGTILLNSFVDVNAVVIEIKDDGKGINTEIITKKAIEKGIITETKAKTMTYSEKLGLIFAPGFSTAEKVTDISGRGVGMDVVKSNINKLKGTVLIDSTVGKGTTIQLRFPLSIIVIRCLYIYLNQICYAIPLQQIQESITLNKGEVYPRRPKQKEGFRVFPIYSLQELLWENFSIPKNIHSISAISVKDSEGISKLLLVDRFSILEEAVVHSVDSYISSIPGIQGGVIRKDGSVTVALNIDSIMEASKDRKPIAYARLPIVEAKEASNLQELPRTLDEFLAKASEKAS